MLIFNVQLSSYVILSCVQVSSLDSESVREREERSSLRERFEAEEDSNAYVNPVLLGGQSEL